MPATANPLKFTTDERDAAKIRAIVKRARTLAESLGGTLDAMDVSMSLSACHANGCRLDLSKLLRADDFTFSHDVGGIVKHISRSTGRLGDCFLPRCSSPL